MVSINSLLLIDALSAGSNNEQRRALSALYRDAFSNSKSFKELVRLLEESEFYGPSGLELKRTAISILKDSLSGTTTIMEAISQIKAITAELNHERAKTEKSVASKSISGEHFAVIDKDLSTSLVKFCHFLLDYSCCMFAPLCGSTVLPQFRGHDNANIVDLLVGLDDAVHRAIDYMLLRRPCVWKISKEHFCGANLVEYSGFSLNPVTETWSSLQSRCRHIGMFLLDDPNDPNVLCYGVGYLTNITPDQGIQLLESRVLLSPPLNCLDHVKIDYPKPDISSLLSTVAGSRLFIVDPAYFTEILNRRLMIQSAIERKNLGKCIYCGKNGCNHLELPKEYSLLPENKSL